MRADPNSFCRAMACVPILAAWLAAHSALPSAQAPNGPPPAAPSPALAPASLDIEAREKFLASARIIHEKAPPKGTTNTRRVTLSDGTLTHDASVQTIDEAKAVFQGTQGTELNFKDSWRFNVAAYRIDRLLAIGMIPATVERNFNGKPGSFTWWVDDVLMDEQERYRQKRVVPDTSDWNEQMWITRLFDQLIANVDRNLGNLLIDKAYNIWMIDHSRAFRLNKDLRSPGNLSRVDRALLDRLRQMTRDNLSAATGKYLTEGEVDALLNRRDRIVAHFDQGGSTLIFDRRAR
jgi:hypothetical protein